MTAKNMNRVDDFDAFTEIKRDNSIVKEFFKPYSPVAVIGDNNVIEFNCLPQTYMFTNLSTLRLKVCVQVLSTVDANHPKPISPTDLVTTTNNIVDSLFRSIEFELNGTEFENSIGQNHPYKSYLNLMLDRDSKYLNSIGAMRGYFEEPAGVLGLVEPGKGNPGVSDRHKLFTKSGEHELSLLILTPVPRTNLYRMELV